MVQWGGFDQSGLIQGFALKSQQATMFLRANLFQNNMLSKNCLLAPQSGALRISAYRDFHPNPIPYPIHL